MYEVLRDSGRREMYDKFLVEGMPDWRSALYYYRRARKMGMLEITVILSLITTIGQYLTAWAGYKEKRLTIVRAGRRYRGVRHYRKSVIDRWCRRYAQFTDDLCVFVIDVHELLLDLST